jgi:hypothetical protein
MLSFFCPTSFGIMKWKTKSFGDVIIEEKVEKGRKRKELLHFLKI